MGPENCLAVLTIVLKAYMMQSYTILLVQGNDGLAHWVPRTQVVLTV